MNHVVATAGEYSVYGVLLTALSAFGPWPVAIAAMLIVLTLLAPRIVAQVVTLVAVFHPGAPGEHARELQALSAGTDRPPKKTKRKKTPKDKRRDPTAT